MNYFTFSLRRLFICISLVFSILIILDAAPGVTHAQGFLLHAGHPLSRFHHHQHPGRRLPLYQPPSQYSARLPSRHLYSPERYRIPHNQPPLYQQSQEKNNDDPGAYAPWNKPIQEAQPEKVRDAQSISKQTFSNQNAETKIMGRLSNGQEEGQASGSSLGEGQPSGSSLGVAQDKAELSLEDQIMLEVIEEWSPRVGLADEEQRFRKFKKGERVDRVYSEAPPLPSPQLRPIQPYVSKDHRPAEFADATRSDAVESPSIVVDEGRDPEEDLQQSRTYMHLNE